MLRKPFLQLKFWPRFNVWNIAETIWFPNILFQSLLHLIYLLDWIFTTWNCNCSHFQGGDISCICCSGSLGWPSTLLERSLDTWRIAWLILQDWTCKFISHSLAIFLPHWGSDLFSIVGTCTITRLGNVGILTYSCRQINSPFYIWKSSWCPCSIAGSLGLGL